MKKDRPNPVFKDPVCGMEISRESAAAEVEHGGETYYFCADVCKDRFLQDPGAYLRRPEDQR